MALTFQQADAIIEQLTTRIHGLIGTDYRDAAIDAASRAKSSETKAKTSETNAKSSETKAKTSETNAKSSETKAKTSEGESASQAELSTEAAAVAALSALAFDQLVGEGFPEGKVEAPVGSIYTDRLATNGAIRWIKTSGTGNTGWQVEPSADTITTLATWTADAVGVRNHFSYTHLSNLENWHSSTYFVLKEVIQLEPNVEYTFHVEEITADTEGEWTVLNLMDGTDGILPYKSSNPKLRIIYNHNNEDEPRYGRTVHFTAPSSGKVYFEFYPNGKYGEDVKPFWVTEKLVRAQLVRGREVPEWRPSPEDAVAGLTGNGESTSPLPSPFPQHDPAHTIRTDSSVGTRVFVGDTMIHGDTGWRDISGNIQPDWTGTAKIKRTNDSVTIVSAVKPDEALVGTARKLRRRLLQLPNGFYSTGHLAYQWKDQGNQNGMVVPLDMGFAINMLDIRNADHDMGTWTSSTMAVSFTFEVDADWPTSLPGTPI